MATRLRYVFSFNGEYSAGGAAKRTLEAYGGKCRSIQEMRVAQAKLKASGFKSKLWIFREPRILPYSRSRYQQICSYLGITAPHKKKKKGVFNVGANPAVGLADQAIGGVANQQVGAFAIPQHLQDLFAMPQPHRGNNQ